MVGTAPFLASKLPEERVAMPRLCRVDGIAILEQDLFFRGGSFGTEDGYAAVGESL